jgi:hypothetical protein
MESWSNEGDGAMERGVVESWSGGCHLAGNNKLAQSKVHAVTSEAIGAPAAN